MKSDDTRPFVVDARLFARLEGDDKPSPAKPSPRQREILRHLKDGHSHRSIGETLGISQATVDRHVANLYIKMGVSSRQDAVKRARELGWLPLE